MTSKRILATLLLSVTGLCTSLSASSSLIGSNIHISGVDDFSGVEFLNTTVNASAAAIEFSQCFIVVASGCQANVTFDFGANGFEYLLENQSAESFLASAGTFTLSGFSGLTNVITLNNDFSPLGDPCSVTSSSVLTCHTPAGFSVLAGSQNSFSVQVPEPSIFGLLLVGLLGFAFPKRQQTA